MGQRLVLALGGNALGNSQKEQLRLIQNTASAIVDLIESGIDVVVTHGNGPQVGMIKVATDTAAQHGNTPVVPFPEASAMSQGYIGYHLQQALQNELAQRSIDKPCVSLITQTLVDAADPAFDYPSKPVGAFYSEEEAKKIMAETGHTFVEDAGRGWRWVVASPQPTSIVEQSSISNLINNGSVVISTGGGGIPVVEKNGKYEGVPAVIDKDRSAALLAHQIGAQYLVILTAVNQVAINFNTPKQENLTTITAAEARGYIASNQFAKGSMLPKIEACIEYVEHTEGGRAVVTSLENAKHALTGEGVTTMIAK